MFRILSFSLQSFLAFLFITGLTLSLPIFPNQIARADDKINGAKSEIGTGSKIQICTLWSDCAEQNKNSQDDQDYQMSFNSKNLSGADFHDANLSRADFSGANLSLADFSNADLSDIKLKQVKNQSNINFSGLDWKKINLSKEDVIKIAQSHLSQEELISLIDPNLSGFDFSRVDWKKSSLSHEDAVKIAQSKLKSADFLDIIKSDINLLSILSTNDLLFLVELKLNDGGIWWDSTLKSQDLVDLLVKRGSLSNIDLSGVDLHKID